jgi:NAD(P)-dependent dehydrogenase (short-subunit alcohol dehydrogenase family)
MSMPRLLVTGGAGDWAKSFSHRFCNEFDIVTPNRTQLDVTNPQSVQQSFDDNCFDIVINNAGSIHPKTLLEADTDLWINDINVNLIGTFLVTKSALAENKNAIIINISSTAGFNYYANWSSYCASKAAVVSFSKCLAKDNFSVYCLCPGAIDTKFRDNLNLSNANAMSCDEMSDHVIDVINGKYTSGDVLFFRKNEFILNP